MSFQTNASGSVTVIGNLDISVMSSSSSGIASKNTYTQLVSAADTSSSQQITGLFNFINGFSYKGCDVRDCLRIQGNSGSIDLRLFDFQNVSLPIVSQSQAGFLTAEMTQKIQQSNVLASYKPDLTDTAMPYAFTSAGTLMPTPKIQLVHCALVNLAAAGAHLFLHLQIFSNGSNWTNVSSNENILRFSFEDDSFTDLTDFASLNFSGQTVIHLTAVLITDTLILIPCRVSISPSKVTAGTSIGSVSGYIVFEFRFPPNLDLDDYEIIVDASTPFTPT